MTSGATSHGLRVVVAEHLADMLDGRGARIARALRDAGHEVVYTGPGQTPEQIVETAIQEDADLIGLMVTAGDHVPLLTALVGLLRAREVDDIVVFAGGIPEVGVRVLHDLGVAGVFAPSAPTTEITHWVAEHFAVEPTAG